MADFLRHVVRQLAVISLGILMSGCLLLPKSQPTRNGWLNESQVFVERQAWLAKQTAWKLTAKVGINTPELRESANLVWQRDGEKNIMRLFGPLGVGSIRIEFDAQQVTLIDSKGAQYKGDNAEQLLSQITGWPIPIEALRYWLFVVPAPGASYQYQLSDESQEIVALEQAGWGINYAKYSMRAGEAPHLPKKIVATKKLSLEGESRSATVRLIVKSWSPL